MRVSIRERDPCLNSRRHLTANIYHRLLQYTRPHWRTLLVAIIGMLMYSLGEVGFAALVKPLLDENLFADTAQSAQWWLSAGIIGVFLLRGLGNYLSVYYIGYVGDMVVRNLRADMFEHLLHLPVAYFDQNQKGTVVSKLTYNVEQTAIAASRALVSIVRDSLTTIGLVAWMFYLNWVVSIFLATLAIPIVFIVRFASRRFRRISRKVQDAYGLATADIQQAIENNAAIKVSGAQNHESSSFADNNEEIRYQKMRILHTRASNVPVVMLVSGFSIVGIIQIANITEAGGTITVGTFVSMLIAIVLLFRPIRNLTALNSTVQAGIAAAESVFEMLDEPPEQNSAVPVRKHVRGDIRFKDVTFRYAGAAADALTCVNLDIRAGETIVLMGRSGSGKSTLISLIPRLYETVEGSIEIDGQDIGLWDLRQLRAQIAYAGQFTVSMRGSIADNIAYGSNASHEEIRKVAADACALTFIEQLPQQFATPINNATLSSGQIQRLVLARTLLRDMPILIFDEITSALDKPVELRIREALRKAIVGRTTIIITHRFTVTELADRIVVMECGRIAGQGTHQELLAECSEYRNLYYSGGMKKPAA